MEAEHQYWARALVVLVLSSSLILFLKRRFGAIRAAQFPRGPPAWPIIGHLPLLSAGRPHRTFANLSRKQGYGPIIGLRLGSTPAVVICSAALAKEVLVTQDKAFASRPHYQFVDTLLYGYDNALAFSSYGTRSAKLRKLYTLELLTAKRLQETQQVRQEGVRGLLRGLLEASGGGTQALCLRDFFADMSSDTISRLLQSKTLSEAGGDSFPKLIRQLEQEATPTVGDFIPWLKLLDIPHKRKMKHIHDRIDSIIESILSDRRQASYMQRGQPEYSELPHDFLQVLLSKLHDKSIQNQYCEEELLTREEIKGSMLDILSAAIHTTSFTLEWAMAELLQNPNCLCKLRDEIDALMGEGENLVSEEDLPKLPYLANTMKEVFRLHPLLPLLLPHITATTVKVDKYILPPNTHVLVNVWAMGRDPNMWENAESFVPERFDNGKNMDVKGLHFQLLPFGAGRRSCPGMRLALSVIHTTIANLVKTFDWELPHGHTNTCMDMSEKGGMAACKITPVLVIPKLRVHS